MLTKEKEIKESVAIALALQRTHGNRYVQRVVERKYARSKIDGKIPRYITSST
ncbi:MAG: hypothetical protein KAU16_00980 [Methanophagales archaeon]|nr:hypothetical protein [Methanophagales archaeon]